MAFQSRGVGGAGGPPDQRVEFARPLPLAAGFAWIEDYLGRLRVPLVGVCARELRSPAQFTDAGFIAFNRQYTRTLKRWGVMKDDNDNPVARSNVIPPLHKPAEPSFHAFCFARSAAGASGPSSLPAAARPATDPPRTPSARSAGARPVPDAMREKARVRARADGGAHGGARQDLGRYHGNQGLHGA